MSEEEKIEQAISNLTRGIDIESAMYIVERCVLDGLIIHGYRVNICKMAVRQILKFLEEYKNKGYLDIVREKVKANELTDKLQKENEELQKENEELKNMSGIDIYKLGQKTQRDKTNFEIERLQKELDKKDEVIDKMAENIASVDFDLCAYIDLTTKNNKCKDTKHCKDCIKQYFYKEVEEVGGEDE